MSINRSSVTPVLLMPGGGETLTGVGVTMSYKTTGAQSAGQWLVMEYTTFAPPVSS